MKTTLLFFTFLITTSLFAQVGTGFEEPFASAATDYVDTLNPLVTHNLINNAGQPSVVHTYAGGELGFQSIFIPTRTGTSASGLTDPDAVGVYTNVGVISSTDATTWNSGNAFIIEDPDGMVRVEFDMVSLAGTTSPQFQMDYWIDTTSYEFSDSSNDRLFIGLDIDNGTSMVTVFDSDGGGPGGGTGNDIDDLGIEEIVQNANVDLTPYIGSNIKLIVEADFNSGSEKIIIDNITFTEGTIATLGIEETEASFEFKVYPNPVKNELHINANENITSIKVYNMLGQEVMYIEPNMLNSKIDVSSLNSGAYFVRVSTDRKTKTIKVIKN